MSARHEAILPKLFTFRRDHHAHARLDELFELTGATATQEERVFWFVRLMAWLRPRRGEEASKRVRFVSRHLAAHPEVRARVSRTVAELAASVDVTSFLTYGGIPRDFHLLGAVTQWLTERALPSRCRTTDLERIVCLALREDDVTWIAPSGVADFLVELAGRPTLDALAAAAREAMLDLCHQVAAQAHAPAVRNLPALERSPFRGLYEAAAAFVREPGGKAPYDALRGRLRECLRTRDALRAHHASAGADLNTSFQLLRIQRQLARLDLLAVALHEGRPSASRVAAELTRRAVKSRRAGHLLSRSSELVVKNLVDTTAEVGDRYLDERSSSLRNAVLAGAGGGLLMVVATLLKLAIASLHLPHLYEGIAFSINYGAAFCAAYLLHFTIATKLPAHTATALARSVQGGGTRTERVAAFRSALVALVRLQIGGLLGNLAVAGPLAFAIAFGFRRATGHALIPFEKTTHILEESSLLGPSALFAALTGVFPWLSSLAGAAVDNWARVNRLADSLATSVPVMKTIGVARAESVARKIAGRVGGLFGNAFLGFLLGAVPALFAVLALPVEIRHVTVSTASVAIAFASADIGVRAVVLCVLGVLVIAIVNVAVSFILALRLALRASDDPAATKLLVRAALRRATALRRRRGSALAADG